MPTLTIDMGLAHPDGSESAPVTAVVDVGADHSMMPQSLLERLGIAPRQRLRFVTDDGAQCEYGYGLARFSIDGDEWPCPVVFGPDGAYMLGASALEIFNLDADLASGQLIPAEGLSLGRAGQPDDALMTRPTAVAPLAGEGYRIWLRYSDGVAGEVDLSELAGRGVFSAWKDRAFFESVRLAEGGAIAWGDNIDLCPDALYLRLTGKSVAELMPRAAAGECPEQTSTGLETARHRSESYDPVHPLSRLPSPN